MMSVINKWAQENSRDRVNNIFLFLLSPFLGLIYAFRSLNTKTSYRIIFAACIVFGVCFTVNNVRTDGSGDGITFRQEFENYQGLSEHAFLTKLDSFWEFDDGEQDMYFDTVAFLVSRVTDNYHVMFMVFAIVFAFFQLKSLRYFSSSDNYRNSLCCFILLALFLWNSIFNINGMRFWTAAWVAVFVLFKVLRDENWKYLALALITPFMHGAYWGFIALLLIGILLKKFNKSWITIYLVSAVISSVVFSVIELSTDYLPAFMQSKLDYYSDTEYLDRISNPSGSGFYWLEPIFNVLSKVYINALVIVLIICRKRIIESYNKNLYTFLIVYMSFVNMLLAIPTIGGRFLVLSYPLIAYLWIEHIDLKKYKWLIYAFPFAFLINIKNLLHNYMSVTPSDFFYTSPIYLVVKYLF